MTEHQIKKPTLFISHASSDGEFANAVKQEVEKVFANGISVFCTSSPGTIPIGVDWLSDIEQKLGATQAVIVIITPVSIEGLGFGSKLEQLGLKGEAGTAVFTPCAPQKSTFPSYLHHLTAFRLSQWEKPLISSCSSMR